MCGHEADGRTARGTENTTKEANYFACEKQQRQQRAARTTHPDHNSQSVASRRRFHQVQSRRALRARGVRLLQRRPSPRVEKFQIATKENRGVKSRVKSLAGFGQSVTVHKINSLSPRVPSRSRTEPPLPQPPLRVEPCAPPHSLTPYDRLRTPRRTRAARGGSRTSHAAQRRIHSTPRRPQRRAMRTPHLSNAPARRPGHNRLFGASTRTSLADQRRRRGTRRGGGGDFEFR